MMGLGDAVGQLLFISNGAKLAAACVGDYRLWEQRLRAFFLAALRATV